MSPLSAPTTITEVPVLDRIPGLAARLPAPDLAQARNVLRADVVTMSRGEHDLTLLCPDGSLGLLVLDGWLIRHVELGGRTVSFLAGPGSFVRPRRVVPGSRRSRSSSAGAPSRRPGWRCSDPTSPRPPRAGRRSSTRCSTSPSNEPIWSR